MIVGFHYHIPVRANSDGSLETQSFYGLFVDSLANVFSKVVVFSYTPLDTELSAINYRIQASNIDFVNLGPHSSVPNRVWRFCSQYSLFLKWSGVIDVLLVRSPTPATLLFFFLRRRVRVVLLLVGSYTEGAKDLKFGFLKKSLIRLLGHAVEYCQIAIIRGNIFMANSEPLLEQFRSVSKEAHLVKTTTLSRRDFYERADVFPRPQVRVLFTGRIDESKGLFEIVDACILLSTDLDIEFHFAGLTVKGKEGLPAVLLERAKGTRLESKIFYHGLKKVGDELNKVYRMCDIYVVGSKSDFEGFPRTIWEAMANSLPVIASPKGSIGYFLRDGVDALLLREVTPSHIAERIFELYSKPEVARSLIQGGLSLARENTLEGQAQKIRNILAL